MLSVFERTRELGMLRAVGMTRRQVRRMIRHESIVTALIGATFGIGVGIFLAGIVTHALSDQGVHVERMPLTPARLLTTYADHLSLAKTRSGSQVVDLSAQADHNLVS